MKDEKLTIVCVPTSYQARQLIIDNNLPLGTLDVHPKVSRPPRVSNTFASVLLILENSARLYDRRSR